jgi:hypothetical protein
MPKRAGEPHLSCDSDMAAPAEVGGRAVAGAGGQEQQRLENAALKAALPDCKIIHH